MPAHPHHRPIASVTVALPGGGSRRSDVTYALRRLAAHMGQLPGLLPGLLPRLVLVGLCMLWALGGLIMAATAVAAEAPPARTDALPRRVVSLAPNLTEIVYALGAEHLLAGRTTHCTYPPAAQKLPAIGSYFRPDLERVLALRPDLCLAMADGTPPGFVRRLRGLGIRVEVLEPDNLPQLLRSIERLGHLLHQEQRAQQLVEAARETVSALAASLPPLGQRPSVLVQIQARPFMAAGPETFLGELVRLAGGRSALPEHARYVRLSEEAVLAMNPDVVLIAGMNQARTREEMALWHGRRSVTAVRQNRVHILDADAVTRPALRGVAALRHLADLLAPRPLAAVTSPETTP